MKKRTGYGKDKECGYIDAKCGNPKFLHELSN
jgi:hypothetical protein